MKSIKSLSASGDRNWTRAGRPVTIGQIVPGRFGLIKHANRQYTFAKLAMLHGYWMQIFRLIWVKYHFFGKLRCVHTGRGTACIPPPQYMHSNTLNKLGGRPRGTASGVNKPWLSSGDYETTNTQTHTQLANCTTRTAKLWVKLIPNYAQ